MLYENFVLSQLWSHMMDDSRIIKKNKIRTSQQKCVANTRWLNWGGGKNWRGGKGSGKYWGLQFVHSFSSTQVLSQALNTEESQQQPTCII
jgi:hypothetical protein